MKSMREEMTLTAVQLAAKMDLDPRVRVRDCRKRRSEAEVKSSNGLSNLISVGKSFLGNLWGKKSAPSTSGLSSSTPIASRGAIQ